MEWVLHGVLAEMSGRADSIYVWHLLMPLTAPVDVLDLSWSDRIGGGSQTYIAGSKEADAALLEAANRARRAHRENSIVVDSPGGADNVHMQEALAYGLLVGGDVGSASEVLGRVLRYQPSRDWETEMSERAGTVRRLLDESDVSGALDLIGGWRTATLDSLGLLHR
ncbi:MAG TPA: hypothetical protein VFZ77_16080 [Acidimicrobiales bacterium]